jgi:hypothetical protein
MAESFLSGNVIEIIILAIVPIVTGVIAKYKIQFDKIKEKMFLTEKLIKEVNEVMKDDVVTPEEARRLITIIRSFI